MPKIGPIYQPSDQLVIEVNLCVQFLLALKETAMLAAMFNAQERMKAHESMASVHTAVNTSYARLPFH